MRDTAGGLTLPIPAATAFRFPLLVRFGRWCGSRARAWAHLLDVCRTVDLDLYVAAATRKERHQDRHESPERRSVARYEQLGNRVEVGVLCDDLSDRLAGVLGFSGRRDFSEDRLSL